jgi:hypothetical protein
MIILGIVLLRGLGAWLRRRQAKQENAESPGDGRRRVEPGDPDAFDVEAFDLETSETLEGGWVPDWERTPQPPPEVLSETERQRQEVLRRLAQTTGQMAQAPGLMQAHQGGAADRPLHEGGRAQRATGESSKAAHISHHADRASALHTALLSRQRIQQAWLLREVLGPPVALRGPLRPSGTQPR